MADSADVTDVIEEEVDLLELHQNDLMDQFDELTFREKWARVSEGLKLPPETGAHKWAKLQMIRLISPAMAVVVPFLMLGLIALLSQMTPDRGPTMKVKVIEPEPIEELEEIEEPVFEPIEPPEPVEVDFTPDVTMPSTDVAAPPQEVSVQPADFDSVAITKSPVIMKGMLGSRNPGSQGAALANFGGKGTSIYVLRALRYIKKQQRDDGSWGKDKASMTSLALLAYLAHGDTPTSPEFGSTVEYAIRFLVENQKADGHFKSADNHDYTQPIAAYALSEAYGLTKVPSVKAAAIKALKIIVKGQNPSGSFNYNLIPTTRDDLSYAAWCVQALKAAKMSGLYGDVEGLDECMQKAIAGMKVHYGEKDGYGGFGYSHNGNAQSGLTGAGVLCLQFLGDAASKECQGGLAGLSDWEFNWETPRAGSFLYYMYYVTQAKFQQGGGSWTAWNNQFKPTLIKHQDVVGKAASGYVDHLGKPQEIGSWVSPAKREHTGGNPIMETILCTLMLEVYYRYLPTFMAVPQLDAEEVEEDIGGDEGDIEIDFVDNRMPSFKLEKSRYQASRSDDLLSLDLI